MRSHLQLFGWLLFAISGGFFVAIGVQDDDWLTLGSAAAWLLGVGVFIAAELSGGD